MAEIWAYIERLKNHSEEYYKLLTKLNVKIINSTKANLLARLKKRSV